MRTSGAEKGPVPLTVGVDKGTGALLLGDTALETAFKEAEPADPDPNWTDPDQEGWHIGPLGRGKGQYGPLVKVVVLSGSMWRGELVEGPTSQGVIFCLHKAEFLARVDGQNRWTKTYWPVFIPRTSIAWWTKTTREED